MKSTGREPAGHDAILDDWSLCVARGTLYFMVGRARADSKHRFADGELMTISLLRRPRADVVEGAVVETLNTRYLLGKAAAEVSFDAFLYAGSLGGHPIGPDGVEVRSMTVKPLSSNPSRPSGRTVH